MYQYFIPFLLLLLLSNIASFRCNRICLYFPFHGFTQCFKHLFATYLSIEIAVVIKSAQTGGKEMQSSKVANRETSVRLF